MIYAQTILLFFIYAFLGWCTEVAFAACKNGKFVNRGFLNGPVCPIYGFGMVGVAVLLNPLKDNLLLMYLGSAVLTTVIEYITGLLLERIFHAKWWDYSNMPLNIGGYVCLLFSLIWGAMCVAIVRYVHPLIACVVEHLPNPLIIVLDGVFFATIAVDLVATLAAIRKLTSRMKALEYMAGEIHNLSDSLGLHISEHTLEAKAHMEAKEEAFKADVAQRRERFESAKEEMSERVNAKREQFESAKEEFSERAAQRYEQSVESRKERLAELKAKFDETVKQNPVSQRRLIKAFPTLQSHHYSEALKNIREVLYSKSKKD